MNTLSDKQFDDFLASSRIPRVEKQVKVNFPKKKRRYYYPMAASILLIVFNVYLMTGSVSSPEVSINDDLSTYQYLENPTTYTLVDDF